MAILCTILTGAAASAEALTADAVKLHPSTPILDLVFAGPHRLSRDRAEAISGIRQGDPLASVDPDAVVQRFLKTGLFSEVRLDYELTEGGARLTVWLREKWTFIPLPLAAVANGQQAYGLMLMDGDFLGSGLNALGGGLWANDRWLGIASLGSHLGADLPGYQLILGASEGARRSTWLNGEAYQAWKSTDYAAALSVSSPLAGELGGKLGLSFRSSTRLDDSSSFGAPPNSSWLSGAAGLLYRRQRQHEYFTSGYSLSLNYEHGLSTAGASPWDSISSEDGLGLRVFDDSSLQLALDAEFSDRPQSAEVSIKDSRLLSGLVVSTDRYAAASASLDIPIGRLPWAVLTLGAFYEGGVFLAGPRGGREIQAYQGPGLSFQLFLRNVALSAFGVNMGYDIAAAEIVYSAKIGFSIQ